ncbi:MAG: hypothetical protein LQ342_007839 [Letrouitia transgressa]|nr:MAG: hypothetical protein LQ342_007839 [Letrouitia transgressa]
MGSQLCNGDKPPDRLVVASLERIDCASLWNGGTDEGTKLLRACRNDGFFYLDIGSQGGFLQATEEIYTLEHHLFDMPKELLREYDIDKLGNGKLNGYKPLGRNRGGLANGKDGFESYAVYLFLDPHSFQLIRFQLPKDGILSLASTDFQRPQIITKYLPSLRVVTTAVVYAAQAIFTTLTRLLDLPRDSATLQSLHRRHICNSDIIRLLKYRKLSPTEQGAPHIAHTDIGSLTFLFTKQPGLQVQRSAGWEWVAPAPPGSVIVNLGDGLSMLSGGYLKSCLHRVIPFPGEAKERYSFAYMLRPENEVLMRDLRKPLVVGSESKFLTSAEWFEMKYKMLRGATWTEEENWMLSRDKETASA